MSTPPDVLQGSAPPATKAHPLRVLIVEDRREDAELLLLELRRGGFEPQHTCVQTRPEMQQALAAQAWDIVLSDYSLPQFSALAAFSVLRESNIDLPFIIVSGTVGEELAVEAMKTGAHDFFVKGKLTRLGPAITREVREAEIRRERKKMQEQLLLSDRMATVGTLAAGVAHEINNPLAALMSNLSLASKVVALLKSESHSPHLAELEELLNDAGEAAERVRLVARDLKVFSRGDEDRPTLVHLRDVLESSLRMAWNEIRHRARVVKHYEVVPPVEASDSRLGQVFLNLIINAAQAIPEGNVEQNEVRVHTRQGPDGRVLVDIADTGSGIPAENLSRIFDVFFTTKPLGIGTGLGLAICQRVIQGLGGEIQVESQVGKGTTFRVVLPAAAVEARPLPPSRTTPVAAAGRRGRILIVDDERMVATSIRRVLSDENDVEIADSGHAALARIVAGEKFDAILCDLMMPEMTGMDLYDALQETAPAEAECMIFMTGGVFTARARDFLEQTPNLRVEKPFDPNQIRAIVNAKLR